jgi:ABC-type transporter Mla subunit MlaD
MPESSAKIPATKIPQDAAEEIRRLAHNLSNALEVILQSSYLLQMSNLDDNAKKWATMVDQGTQQAAEINRQLREFIRSHTA